MRTTKSFKRYMKLYGPHFTKALCDYAVSLMEDQNGRVQPFSKADVERILESANIKLKYNKLYDAVYVANMCKADFLNKSVPNDDPHIA
jgi:predicted phosphoadenosine phosphosulfate sulfurtransferase